MASTALSILAFSAPAHAGCDGLYLAGRGGIVNHNLGDSKEALGNRLDIDDNALMASGAIGYRYGYFRVEGEYIWREETSKEWGSAIKSKSDFESLSYMLNLYYDFSPYTMFTPYVMAGLGMTNITYKFSGGGAAAEEFDTDNFTWALGGGISAKVTNRFNVDLGYRFFNMGEIEHASVRAHEIYLGLRYVF